jgi:hypothetical protein
VAFIVSPATPSLLAVAMNNAAGSGEGNPFILQVGLMLGYFLAFTTGFPAYLKYLRGTKRVRFRFFVFASIIYTAGMFLLIAALLVAQSGPMAMFSSTLWSYTFLFGVSVCFALSTFYLIAFFNLRRDE